MRLTDEDVRTIRAEYPTTRTAELAQRFQVSSLTITKTATGRSHSYIVGPRAEAKDRGGPGGASGLGDIERVRDLISERGDLLGDKAMEALTLRYGEPPMTYQAIADVLGISKQASEQRVVKGLVLLAKA